jgi:hypothetical protein
MLDEIHCGIRLHEGRMRLAARRHSLPLLLIGLSIGALLGIWLLCRQGYCDDPFGSMEILVVPLLCLALFPASLALTGGILTRVHTACESLTSGRRWSSCYRILLVVLLVLLVGLVFARLLRARWGEADDHEIMAMLGTHARLALADIPSLLSRSEIAAFGTSARFRPVYSFLRLIEVAAWGREPMLWYAARLGLLTVSVIIFWSLVSPILGGVGGALLCAYAMSFPFWVDVIGRLGPSEAYAVLGLPIYLVGLVRASRADSSDSVVQGSSGALILVGTLLCVGSKENFLILTAPTLLLGYRAMRHRQYLLLAGLVISIAFSGYVASSIMLASSRSGVDVYGAPISIGSRLKGILELLWEQKLGSPFTMLMAVTLAPSLLLLPPGLRRAKRAAILSAQLWLAVLCIVYITQWVFYGADWLSREQRYLFPGLLYLPASVVVLFRLGRELLSGLGKDARMSRALTLSLAVSLVLAILYHRHYDPVIQALREHVIATREFTSTLERMVTVLQQDEDVPLVAEGGDDVLADYERAYSYPRFLRAYGVVNPLFLRLHGYTHESFPPGWLRELASGLEETSANGGDYYSPLGMLAGAQGGCYALYLTTESKTSCSPIR